MKLTHVILINTAGILLNYGTELSVQLISAQQNPTISFISKETVTDIGDTAELKCSVQYADNFPVSYTNKFNINPYSTIEFFTSQSSGYLDEIAKHHYF